MLEGKLSDPGWMTVHQELVELHQEKSLGYGTSADALSNYVFTASVAEKPAEYVCYLRILEKAVRAINLINSGQSDRCDEGKDIAALGIAAEALKRRK